MEVGSSRQAALTLVQSRRWLGSLQGPLGLWIANEFVNLAANLPLALCVTGNAEVEGLRFSRTMCPLWVDTVEKLSDEHRAGNNRIQVPRSLNQCCAPDSYLESCSLAHSQTVFQQHRSNSEEQHPARDFCFGRDS